MADLSPDPGSDDALPGDPATARATPRWVKVFGAALIGLVLVAAIVTVSGLGGEHGPARHVPGSPSSSPVEGGHVPPAGAHPAASP